jgi:hypothetical protein
MCGKESNATTCHLAVMNLALRSIEADYVLENCTTLN